MKLEKTGIAGTMESSDAYIEIEPSEGGLEISLESTVGGQFGKHIKALVKEVVLSQEVENAKVRVMDKGALDCTLRARILTAIERAGGKKFCWE